MNATIRHIAAEAFSKPTRAACVESCIGRLMAEEARKMRQPNYGGCVPETVGCADDLAKWTVRESGLSHARLVPYLWLWAMGFPNGWGISKELGTP